MRVQEKTVSQDCMEHKKLCLIIIIKKLNKIITGMS